MGQFQPEMGEITASHPGSLFQREVLETAVRNVLQAWRADF